MKGNHTYKWAHRVLLRKNAYWALWAGLTGQVWAQSCIGMSFFFASCSSSHLQVLLKPLN